MAWTPSSGNIVVEWSNVAWCHVVSDALWHVSHAVGNPPATWGGDFAAS